jgi:hypothetical protein
MEVFEVVPGLYIGTRLAETADYDSLGVEVIIDLEDWTGLGLGPVGPTREGIRELPDGG